MRDDKVAPRVVRGRALHCPVCQHDSFHSHQYLLNTRVAAFMNLDWSNRAATTYICAQCGHILWFVEDPARVD